MAMGSACAWAITTATAAPTSSSRASARMSSCITRETARSPMRPRRPASVVIATGRPRRRLPTSTATAISTCMSATTWHGTSCIPRSATTPPRSAGSVSCLPLGFPARRDHLYRNDGGHFTDVTESAGIIDRDGRGLGVVVADFDDDGRIDLFVANDMTANYLFKNLGNMRFEEVGHLAGVACNSDGGYQAGMGVAFGDLDHDGRGDLAVTNFFGESTTVFRNLASGVYSDATAAVGLKAPSRFLLGFGITFLDVDNDGCLDLATANGHVSDLRPNIPHAMPAQLLTGDSLGRLKDVTRDSGAVWNVPRVGRGLAHGDLDNDGRVDLLLVAQNSPLAYLHNQTARAGHFITLRLEGNPSNRDAVGARVTITAGGRARRPGGRAAEAICRPATPASRLASGRQRSPRRSRFAGRRAGSTIFFNLAADTGYLIREIAIGRCAAGGVSAADFSVRFWDGLRTISKW